MNRTLLSAAMLVLSMATLGASAYAQSSAQIPRTISYQGVLTDPNGNIVPDGNHILTLTVYDAANNGTELYSETHAVPVVRGTFNVIIGSVNPIPPTLKFDRAYFLGVSVDGRAELSPRTPMLAVPYALRAIDAETAVSAEHAATADLATLSQGLAPGATGFVRSVNGRDGDLEIVGTGSTQIQTLGNRLTIFTKEVSSGITSIHSIDAALAVTDGTGPAVSLSLVPGGITEALIGDAAIANRKLRNGAVTTDKLADASVTAQKMSTGGAPSGMTLVSTGTGTPIWGNPIATAIILPRSDTVNTPFPLWSLYNSGSGGAGRFTVLNAGNGADALSAATVGSGNALSVSGKLFQSNGGVVFDGTVGVAPVSGPGTRMMWVPSKGAFRSGYVNANQWDQANLGDYSTAMGYRPTASGNSSVSLGNSTVATGDYSVAIGRNATASGLSAFATGQLSVAGGSYATAIGYQAAAPGDYATALGYNTIASADYATAMGQRSVASASSATAMGWSSTASGVASTAMGEGTIASGLASTALGLSTVASGENSLATGNSTRADGDNATAMGSAASTNGYSGSFVWGDASTSNVVNASADNEFALRASGGMVVYTDSTLSSKMHLEPGGMFSIQGSAGMATVTGAGTRMMWVPYRAAFRAGYVDGGQWDDANLGNWSFSSGYNTLAIGNYSVAMGRGAQALNTYAVAMGTNTNASGFASTALGWASTSLGTASFAVGFSNTAGGNNSFAAGNLAVAQGNSSVAMGTSVSALGDYSVALGSNSSTGTNNGSFVFGDASTTTTVTNTGANEFMVRAAGGTVFYSNAAMSTGVSLAPGAGAWATLSDRTKKENFRTENPESVLNRLASIPVTSWNYLSQDRSIRHMGPMAQDFHAAFGLGESDTTITTTDVDGVTILAVQALARRTDELRARTAELESLRREVAELRARLGDVDTLRARLEELRMLLEESGMPEVRQASND